MNKDFKVVSPYMVLSSLVTAEVVIYSGFVSVLVNHHTIILIAFTGTECCIVVFTPLAMLLSDATGRATDPFLSTAVDKPIAEIVGKICWNS